MSSRRSRPGARPGDPGPKGAGEGGGRRRAALTQADYERLAQLRYLLRRFLAFSERAAVDKGLTAQQHQAMLAIKGFGVTRALSTGELAERLDIRHHSAVGLLDRLAGRGLIRRHAGKDDRRQVLIELTPRAEGLLRELSAAHRDELERLAPLLAHFETLARPA